MLMPEGARRPARRAALVRGAHGGAQRAASCLCCGASAERVLLLGARDPLPLLLNHLGAASLYPGRCHAASGHSARHRGETDGCHGRRCERCQVSGSPVHPMSPGCLCLYAAAAPWGWPLARGAAILFEQEGLGCLYALPQGAACRQHIQYSCACCSCYRRTVLSALQNSQAKY